MAGRLRMTPYLTDEEIAHLTHPTKLALLDEGRKTMLAFCGINRIRVPAVMPVEAQQWNVSACAYYRLDVTRICLARCAAIGVAGPAWSYPGYTVDRTPYGVIQHELGHHVDVTRGERKGAYWSEFSAAVRGQSGEARITSYCPNDAEWFAEMFRVFVTNPDLLRLVRPRTHRELRSIFQPVFDGTWRDRLTNAPARTIAAAAKQIEAARANVDLFAAATP
jgi:hypothetical protein